MNEYILYLDYAEMILYDKHGNEKARTLIDLDDIDNIIPYRWHLDDSNGYIANNTIGYLHRYIMNFPKGMIVDHINRNKLDNRKCNLRVCSKQQNNINKSKQSNNTSGYTGVYWNKRRCKWVAQIKVNSKKIHLGYFENKEDAIESRKKAEEKYFGEYKRIE